MPAKGASCSEIDPPRKSAGLCVRCPDRRNERWGHGNLRNRNGRVVFATDNPPVSVLSFLRTGVPSFRGRGPAAKVPSSLRESGPRGPEGRFLRPGQRFGPVRTGFAKPFGRRATGCSMSRRTVSVRPGGVLRRFQSAGRCDEGRRKVLRPGFSPFGRLGPKVVADKMWITWRGSFQRNPAIIRFFA